MGGIQSNETKETLSEFNDFMNQSVQTSFSSQSTSCSSTNYLRLYMGQMYNSETGSIQECEFEEGGNVNINQNAVSFCELQNYNTTIEGASFSSFISTQVTRFIQNNLQNKSGWFATAFNVNKNSSVTADTISDAISNQFSQNEQNTCNSFISSSNNAYISLCGYFSSDYNINQNTTSQGIVSCINKFTMDAFTNNDELNEFWQKTDQALVNKSSGVASLFSSILLPIVLVIVSVIFLLIIAFLIFSVTRVIVTRITGEDKDGEFITSVGQSLNNSSQALADGVKLAAMAAI